MDDSNQPSGCGRDRKEPSEARLHAILDTAVEGIVTITKEGSIESMNPSALAMFGYEADEVIGQNVKMLMPAPYQEEHDSYLARYLQTGEKRIIGAGREVVGLRKDESTFPMYLSVGEMWIDDKWFFTGIVRDISEQKRAETQGAALGRILEDSNNEIYMFDTVSLRFVRVNRAARENLGYTMKELRQLTPVDIKPKFDSMAFADALSRLRSREQDHVRFETCHQRKDGTTYPVEISIQLSDLGGEPIFAAIVIDTTERKKSEERIAGFGRIMEESLNEIYIFDANTLAFVEVNLGARRNNGYSIDELYGMTPVDLKPEFSTAKFDKLLEQLRSGKKEKLDLRTVHARKDGSTYDVEVHLQMSTWESRDVFVAIILDISERKKLGDDLEESELRYKQIIEESHDMIQSCSPEGRLLFVNQTWLQTLGYSQDDVQQLTVFDIIHPDQRAHYRERFARLFAGEPLHNVQTVFVAKDGTRIDVEGNVACRFRDDKLFGTHGFFRDIRSRKKYEQNQRLSAVGEMVAGIAHESRNALHRIQAGVDLLDMDFEHDEEVAPTLQMIRKAGNDLREVLEEVREFSAPINLNACPIDLSEAWQIAWGNLVSLGRHNGSQLTCHHDGVDLSCEVDGHRLEQVFENLFQNSIAACEGPAAIDLRCEHENEMLVIRVQDNGPGLSAETRKQVFDAFYTTKPEGTGLGLPIVKRFVEAHGGEIAVSDKPREAGTEFVIRLPKNCVSQNPVA